MDTMTYASFAAFRGSVANKSNQPAPREAEFTSLDLSQIRYVGSGQRRRASGLLPSKRG